MDNGQYAIVRKFDSTHQKYEGNTLDNVWNGQLVTNRLYLLHCETILNTVAVVPDNMRTQMNNQLLVMCSCSIWLKSFPKMAVIGRRLFSQLYQEGNDIDNDLDEDDDFVLTTDGDSSDDDIVDDDSIFNDQTDFK